MGQNEKKVKISDFEGKKFDEKDKILETCNKVSPKDPVPKAMKALSES
jgi:hypothetical protein